MNKNKIFFIVFSAVILGTIAFTFWRMVVRKDYIVESWVDCDPAEERCFIWECDPESKVEGEACTGDAEEDIWYYKITKRNAGRVPLCDPEEDETCEPWKCEPDEKDCGEVLCDEENKIEQEAECNDPEEYLKNNPVEDEEESLDEEVCGEGADDCETEEEPVEEAPVEEAVEE